MEVSHAGQVCELAFSAAIRCDCNIDNRRSNEAGGGGQTSFLWKWQVSCGGEGWGGRQDIPGSKGSPSESVLGDGLKLCALETPWIRLKSNR